VVAVAQQEPAGRVASEVLAEQEQQRVWQQWQV
jgi:hypothetical protein